MTNNKKPFISVIMGVYNDVVYLEKAINSILFQSFSNFEFIICNDSSTDKRVEVILENYKKTDDRIIIINNDKNMGLAASLNKCISISKSKYIVRMDSDDISLPNRLECLYNFMENEHSIAVCGSQAYYIDSNGERYKKTSYPTNYFIDFDKAVLQTAIMHPTVIIRKEWLNKVDNYTVNANTLRAEDYDLWCKITQAGGRITVLDNYLFEYREDLDGYNKRKYKYRIQEAKIKFYWLKKSKLSVFKYVYCIKPLLVGLIPSRLMKVIKKAR